MPALGASGGGAKTQTRPGGGFRQSFGGNPGEAHLDEAAMQALGQQKQQQQQASVLGQQGAAKQLAQNQGAGQTPLSGIPNQEQQTPREVSSLKDELIKRPIKDITETFKAFFNLDRLLGINSGDTAEDKAKKQKLSQRWQKLTQEEQEFAKQKYQQELQKKQEEEREKEQKKQEEEAKKQESLPMPQGRQTGFQGFAGQSGKQKAQSMVQRQRTTMSQGE